MGRSTSATGILTNGKLHSYSRASLSSSAESAHKSPLVPQQLLPSVYADESRYDDGDDEKESAAAEVHRV